MADISMSKSERTAWTRGELESAKLSSGRRIPTHSWLLSDGVIGHLQRRGIVRVKIINTSFVDVSLSARGVEAIADEELI